MSKNNFNINNYENWTLVEVGGGTGFNIINMLNAIMKVDIEAFKNMKLILIEKSPYFRKKQIAAIKEFLKSYHKLSLKTTKPPKWITDKNAE